MANLHQGFERWAEIAQCLNDIILDTGKKIDINNRIIWDHHLHRYTNEDWLYMLKAFEAALNEDPSLAQPYRRNNLNRALDKLSTATANTRPLDRRSQGGKKIAWAMINTLRETWNEIQGVSIPNEDRIQKSQKSPQPKTEIEQTNEYTRVTIWHNLFDIEQ